MKMIPKLDHTLDLKIFEVTYLLPEIPGLWASRRLAPLACFGSNGRITGGWQDGMRMITQMPTTSNVGEGQREPEKLQNESQRFPFSRTARRSIG